MPRRQKSNEEKQREMSDFMMNLVNAGTRAMSQVNISEESSNLEARMKEATTEEEHIRLMNEFIATTGTDMQKNKADPYGDGDQTRLQTDRQAQVFRNLWSEGFDMLPCLMAGLYSPFTMACVLGDAKTVQSMLKSSLNQDEIYKLLEHRETTFRATPLQLLTGHSKYPKYLIRLGISMNHEGVARILLKYGARPNAKDASGKTMAHWGAGMISNPTTRKIAGWCILASKSCKHVGQEVTLQGLQKAEYNGLKGILRGFDVLSNRRIVEVTVDDDKAKELALQPKNIFFNGTCIYEEGYNLVDIPDRLGSVVLHEVVMQGDADTARFLCHTHSANVNIADITGISPRFMATREMYGMESEAMRIVKELR